MMKVNNMVRKLVQKEYKHRIEMMRTSIHQKPCKRLHIEDMFNIGVGQRIIQMKPYGTVGLKLIVDDYRETGFDINNQENMPDS